MPRIVLRRPRGFIALSGIAAIIAVLVGAQAPNLEPSELQKLIARRVGQVLEEGHMLRPVINDAVGKRWVVNYLESLDPLKYTFLKADVEEFLPAGPQLDDQLKRGDIDFARTVFERFLKRSDERLADTLEILEHKPDFTIDESIVDDPKRVDYPQTAAEAKDRLRKLLKLDLLRRKVAKMDEAEAIHQLQVRYKDLNRYYHQFDGNDLLERYLTALAMAIDPQSAYWQAKTVEDLMGQQFHLSLEGIGASLQVEDGFPVVKDIVPGGAADLDGRLGIEDKIVGIETDGGEKEDFVNKKLSDVVRKIRGPAGTKVRLIVQPSDSKDMKVYELTRQKIDLVEQKAKGQVIEIKAADGKPIKAGIIRLPNFYGDTLAVLNGEPDAVSCTNDCRHILEDFKKQGVQIAVMDLRGNGGGLLPEAISLSGLFIDRGPVVQVKKSDGSVEDHEDEDAGTTWDGPLAVLIDHTSASASEIFAGVIKDYKRGLIIGDSNTYGKGTVQSIVRINDTLPLKYGRALPDLGALKLTIQQFYRANGESTQVRGVTSDIHIPSVLDYQEIGEGTNDNALKFDQIAALPHDNYRRVSNDLIKQLAARSEERRKANPKFQEQAAALKRYVERRKRHEISLNEAKFRAEMIADESDEEETKPKEKKRRHTERPVWESDFYNDEIANILADYLRLGASIVTAGPVPAAANGNALKP